MAFASPRASRPPATRVSCAIQHGRLRRLRQHWVKAAARGPALARGRAPVTQLADVNPITYQQTPPAATRQPPPATSPTAAMATGHVYLVWRATGAPVTRVDSVPLVISAKVASAWQRVASIAEAIGAATKARQAVDATAALLAIAALRLGQSTQQTDARSAIQAAA